jgi:hypothetical protein
MKNLAIVSAMMLVLIVGIVSVSPLTVFADKRCEPVDGQTCVFNLKRGDIKVDDDLVIGPFNIGVSNGSTVDQVARDGVADNSANDAKVVGNVTALQSTVDSLFKEIQGLKADIAVLNGTAITEIDLSNGPVPVVEPPIVNDTIPVPTNDTNTNATG